MAYRDPYDNPTDYEKPALMEDRYPPVLRGGSAQKEPKRQLPHHELWDEVYKMSGILESIRRLSADVRGEAPDDSAPEPDESAPSNDTPFGNPSLVVALDASPSMLNNLRSKLQYEIDTLRKLLFGERQ